MKKTTSILWATAMVAWGAPPVMGDTIRFIGSAGDCGCQGWWDEEVNWEGGIVPRSDDVAWIPSGKQAFVRVDADPVGAVQIDPHIDPEDSQKHTFVWILFGSALPLAGIANTPSIVDGYIEVENGALQIDDDLTIKGDGEIHLQDDGVIGGGGILTIAPSDNCSPLDRDCAIVLSSGEGGEVKAGLTNDAFVVAWRPNELSGEDCSGIFPTLKLTTNPKDGSGFWIAESDGHLQVSAEVKGDGTWVIDDGNSGCHKIIIDACCDEVTGDVRLSEGEFLVSGNGYFCTTGDAYLDGSGPDRGADVVSYSGRTAAFGNVSCSCPQ